MRFLLFLFLFAFCAVNYVNCEPPTPEEEQQLEKLKENLINDQGDKNYDYTVNWINETPDQILVNWLRYTSGDVKKTEANIKKSIEWRLKNNVDKVHDWEPPEYLQTNFQYFITGKTDDGLPVVYTPYGLWDRRTAIQNGLRSEIVKFDVKYFETILRALKEANKENPEVGQFVHIADMKGFGIRQASSIRVLGSVATFLGLYESNYQLHHLDVLIINSPGIFSVILDIIKQTFSAESFERIKTYSDENAWREKVDALAPKSAIPQRIGGDFPF